MPLNLASPGIVVREVDLTNGRVAPSSNAVGAIVSPFAQGPVDAPILVTNEQELLQNFGTPYATDKHYENWLVASSYLAYGGSLQVVRADSTNLKNALAGVTTSIKIKSYDDYVTNGYDENVITGVTVAARNPGSWANGIKVAMVDGRSDQILSGIVTTGISVGMGVTQGISTSFAGVGTVTTLSGYLKGVVTNVLANAIEVKLMSHVSAGGTETEVDYQPNGVYAFAGSGNVAIHTSGVATSFATTAYTTRQDWYDQQTITLTNGTLTWNNLAERPKTSSYASTRNSRFDEVHVVVIDDLGKVTGNPGTILEKHLSLSKAKDAVYSAGSASYWRKYISESSNYIFAGGAPAGIVTTAFSVGGFTLETDTAWDQEASNARFAGIGATVFTLANGRNYDGGTDPSTSNSLTTDLAELSDGYDLFTNTEQYQVDVLLMGSSGYTKENAQALASKLIAVAEERKDAVACISPHRGALLTETSTGNYVVKDAATITNNVIEFYSSVPSSSYAIFDSGYKYMYDRFSSTYRYVPLNGDIAGLCARVDANSFPWYSPAGTSRGAILNAVKLAYNPTKAQRDRLYSNRVNPVIFSPGSGIILYGDKTGLGRSSAFDRINVRRLFIYLEKAISAVAKDQLFEFNDVITRNNFVNTVEPFLRDIVAKRGIEDFRLICNETNNTAAVINNNEFVADIYIKPNRTINFIGLTFVATRSGVSFEEIIGV